MHASGVKRRLSFGSRATMLFARGIGLRIQETLRYCAALTRISGFSLLSLDKDFGELAVVRRISHSGIVRLVGFSAREQGSVCVEILDRFGEELVVGAIVTAEPGRIRVRPKDVG